MVLWIGACEWQAFVNTNVANGVPRRDLMLSQCQTACVNTIYCVGIDFDPNPSNAMCWLTILPAAAGPMQPSSGVTHYVLTRNDGCPYWGEFTFVIRCQI